MTGMYVLRFALVLRCLRSLAGWMLAGLLLCGLCVPVMGRDTPAALAEIDVTSLPAEARHTLQLIRSGGPFPYTRDGVTFGNFERLLPPRPRGYYSEYTVRTPGSRDRGARRIVAGKGGEFYYTDDHYQSFRRIRE